MSNCISSSSLFILIHPLLIIPSDGFDPALGIFPYLCIQQVRVIYRLRICSISYAMSLIEALEVSTLSKRSWIPLISSCCLETMNRCVSIRWVHTVPTEAEHFGNRTEGVVHIASYSMPVQRQRKRKSSTSFSNARIIWIPKSAAATSIWYMDSLQRIRKLVSGTG